MKSINLAAQSGVAVREFPTATGPADYMLFADGKAIGIVEAIGNSRLDEKWPHPLQSFLVTGVQQIETVP